MTVLWIVLLVAGWALVPLPLAVVLGRVFASADPGEPADAHDRRDLPVRRTPPTQLSVLVPASRSGAASLRR